MSFIASPLSPSPCVILKESSYSGPPEKTSPEAGKQVHMRETSQPCPLTLCGTQSLLTCPPTSLRILLRLCKQQTPFNTMAGQVLYGCVWWECVTGLGDIMETSTSVSCAWLMCRHHWWGPLCLGEWGQSCLACCGIVLSFLSITVPVVWWTTEQPPRHSSTHSTAILGGRCLQSTIT